MKQHRKWIIGGIILLVVSIVGGLIGTIWGIQHSFNEVVVTDDAGIGRMGPGMSYALISTVASIIGSLVGLVLTGTGIAKYSRTR